jgi:glucan phosphoethanolaminetransferase (alkaline phosphatase superfamily)
MLKGGKNMFLIIKLFFILLIFVFVILFGWALQKRKFFHALIFFIAVWIVALIFLKVNSYILPIEWNNLMNNIMNTP